MVQFESLGKITSAHVGLFWKEVQQSFPYIWGSFRDMHHATTTFGLPPLTGLPLTHDGSHLKQAFSIRDSAGQFAGRLYTEIAPAMVDDQVAIRFDLTAGGHPRCSTVEAAMEFLDLGRSLIVKFFEQATTEGMHNSWMRA